MSFLRRWFGSRDDDDTGDLPAMPWEGRRSILEFVGAHIVDGLPGLADEGYKLPDEDRLSQGSKVRWAAGAMDGVLTHHMAPGESDAQVAKIVQLVLQFCRQPTAQNKAAVYQHIVEQHVVSIIDPVIEAILNERRIDQRRLYELARSFVTEASDREPVKFGIAILGLFRQPDDQPLFQTLGRHDESTLFCAIALANASEDYEEPLWTLARNATGWGRIQVVERLAETENPAIKNWMLREGYKNSVMYEYLAYTCATTGELLAALSADSIDRELLTSAGELLEALIAGGPAQNIDDYADAAVAVELYLNHLQSMAATLDDFIHAAAIHRFLCDTDDWDARREMGWSDERRSQLRSICQSILERPEWEAQARAGLTSADDVQFHRAASVCKQLGIDPWDHHWRRLQEKPLDAARWISVMADCDDSRIDNVLELAEKSIPLEKVATGAADELGLGPSFMLHSCLDAILQELRRFPGRGASLIEAGLKSPTVRNRNLATSALAEWGREHWPDSTAQVLDAAARVEPDATVRERMEATLRGQNDDTSDCS